VNTNTLKYRSGRTASAGSLNVVSFFRFTDHSVGLTPRSFFEQDKTFLANVPGKSTNNFKPRSFQAIGVAPIDV
jgi:hypothetical protein